MNPDHIVYITTLNSKKYGRYHVAVYHGGEILVGKGNLCNDIVKESRRFGGTYSLNIFEASVVTFHNFQDFMEYFLWARMKASA